MSISQIIHVFFSAYSLVLLVRVVGSWFPRFYYSRWTQPFVVLTNPYLNVFKRLIPPIGGVIDLSPLLGFLALSVMEKIILAILHTIR